MTAVRAEAGERMNEITRWVQERGCTRCNIPVPHSGTCCPQCGGIFGIASSRATIELDWTYQQVWIPTVFSWLRPLTWLKKGEWVRK